MAEDFDLWWNKDLAINEPVSDTDLAELIEDATAYGDARDFLEIGGIYYELEDYQKAYEYYMKAYEEGDDVAANNLGYIYAYGRLGTVDKEKAFYYYSEAALKGNENSLYTVGDAYFYGDFVKQNYHLAFEHYKKAYEASGLDHYFFSDICYRLALCFENGYGTDKDSYEALRFINHAETAIYRDKRVNKFMWQSLMPKIQKLKSEIMASLDGDSE
jgi:TPR repeat protein